MRIILLILLGLCLFLTSVSAYTTTTWTTGDTCEQVDFTPTTNTSINFSNPLLSTYTTATINFSVIPYNNSYEQFGQSNSSITSVNEFEYIEGEAASMWDGSWNSFAGIQDLIGGDPMNVNITWRFKNNFTNPSVRILRLYTDTFAGSFTNKSVFCNVTGGALTYLGELTAGTNNTYTLPSACFGNGENVQITAFFLGGQATSFEIAEASIKYNESYYGGTNLTIYLNNTHQSYNNASLFNESHTLSLNTTFLREYFLQESPLLFTFLANTTGRLNTCIANITYNLSVNVTFRTEQTHDLFNGNMTLDVYSANNPLQKFYTTTGYVNLEHFNATFPLVLEYYDNKSEQPHRFYYTDPEESLNVTLFVQNTTNLTNVLFTLYDEIGNPLPGYYVALQRKYDVDGNYYTIAMHKTDFNGQSLLNAVLYTTLYKLVVYDEDLNLVYSSSETEIKSTSITLTINLGEDLWYGLDNAYGVEVTQIVYNNNTGQFSVSYNDVNHVLNYTTFTVVQRTAFGDLSICENTSTDTEKTYYCTILNPNISGYFTARLWGETLSNHSNFILSQGEYQPTTTPDKMGKAGVFMALLVFILLITFGLYNPAVAIMLACLGLIVIVALKLIFVSIGLIVVIIILGGILLFKMRT